MLDKDQKLNDSEHSTVINITMWTAKITNPKDNVPKYF